MLTTFTTFSQKVYNFIFQESETVQKSGFLEESQKRNIKVNPHLKSTKVLLYKKKVLNLKETRGLMKEKKKMNKWKKTFLSF